MEFIKTSEISYSYPDAAADEGKTPALSGVNIEALKGQYVCVLGRNGSGKSTFAKHLNALLVPDSGAVWIDGADTKNGEKLFEIRRTVGMVFQNPDNQAVASVVEEDTAFGPENLGLPSEKIQSDVNEALRAVGLSDLKKARMEALSGGQRQLAALAGVLAMRPECVVLDEATSMLDPASRAAVMNIVKKLVRGSAPVTVINITHYMDEAALADKIYILNRGKVILSGTPQEVFACQSELISAGLRLPVIAQLAWKLREKGMDIPDGIITAEQLKAAVLRQIM